MSAPRPARVSAARAAAESARRRLVQIVVGPSRVTVLTTIGSIVLFLLVLVFGYFTRR